MGEFQSISPEGRVCSPVRKAEGDSDPALSRLGAGERRHMERMLEHGLDWIAENVANHSKSGGEIEAK
jgi:hypothetical protein